MYSYWENEYWFEEYDILIIGSGIVGLSCAYYLNQTNPKLKIGILDRHSIPLGASTKNAGFACFGTVGEISDDLNHMSEQSVMEIIKLRWEGLKRLRLIHGDRVLNFKNKPGIELFTDEESYGICEANLNKVNALVEEAIGIEDCFQISKVDFSSGLYSLAMVNKFEGSLNPVFMIKNLITLLRKQNIHVISGIEYRKHIHSNENVVVTTDTGIEVTTKKLIFCTNAFTKEFFPELDVVPARNQVFVTEKLKDLSLPACYHLDMGYVYFREVDGRLLIGGARNLDSENEMTSEFGENKLILDYLRDFALNNIVKRDFKIESQWSGIIATGKGKKPILDEIEENVFVGVRLGGMGVAIGSELGFRLMKLIDRN